MMLSSDSASDIIRRLLRDFSEERTGDEMEDDFIEYHKSSPRGMPIREINNLTVELTNSAACIPHLSGRNLNYPFMVAEWLWIMTGRNDVEMISHYNKNIAQFSDDGKNFFGAYGPPWRQQVWSVLRTLGADPHSRQAVVSLWRPDPPPTKDVPCTVAMQYLLRHGMLDVTVTMRSSDAWLGLPYDIFNFSMLLRCVAAELGVAAGKVTINIGSSHLYERDLELVRVVLLNRDTRLKVLAPPVPGIDKDMWLYRQEIAIRSGASSVPYLDNHWWPWLTMLEYRNTKNATTIAPELRQLVQAP